MSSLRAIIFDCYGVLYNGSRDAELLSLVENLRSNYQVGVISNIGRGAFDQIFSIEEQSALFDDVLISGDVGLIKPQPAIYNLAADRLGVTTFECVMIDDSPNNCAGAEAVGMTAILYQGSEKLRQTLDELGVKLN